MTIILWLGAQVCQARVDVGMLKSVRPELMLLSSLRSCVPKVQSYNIMQLGHITAFNEEQYRNRGLE